MRRFSSLSPFTSWRASERPLHIAVQRADTAAGYRAFWCAANPVRLRRLRYHGIQVRVRPRRRRPGMANTRTLGFSHLCDNIVMTRFCQNGHGRIAKRFTQRIRDVAQVIRQRRVRSITLLGADRQSVFHIHIGRIQEAAFIADRQHRQRVRLTHIAVMRVPQSDRRRYLPHRRGQFSTFSPI